MPLKPDPEQRFENFDLVYIHFPMWNGAMKVMCAVSWQALIDLAGLDDSVRLDQIVEAFRNHRPEIEAIASEKYDAGQLIDGEVRVVNSDV